MLHHWFGFIHHHNKVKVQEEPKSKMHYALPTKPTMIAANKKLAPTVKATSVNVTIDEITIINDESAMSFDNNEPLRSASISLSIELAKKTSSISIQQSLLTQKPDTVIMPQSSLPKSMVIHKQQQQRPSSVHSSNSLLHRMAHSPKAAAAAFPTSVSANGNVVPYEEQEEHIDSTVRSSSSAAVQSLSKRIEEFSPTSSPPNELSSEEEETAIEDEAFDSQEMNVDQPKKEDNISHSSVEKNKIKSSTIVGFWTWLGFPSAAEPDQTKLTRGTEKQEEEDVKPFPIETQQEPLEVKLDNSMTSTSASIIPSEADSSNNVIPNEPVTSSVSETSISTKRSSWASYLFQSKPTPTCLDQHIPPSKEIDLRKAKSTSSLQPTVSTTQSLRSSASTSSFHPIFPKKKNQVLPLFDSQFTNAQSEPCSASKTHPTNILTKAMDAINSILIQPPPDRTEDASSWIANRMKAKFSTFVDDLKLHASSNKPSAVMMDKRIVVIGVHGWFPMKLVRSMIGEPTGTSLKFCEQMASGVKLYFESEHQVILPSDAITMVPLEGEGKVEDRVNQLYAKLLDNSQWLEAVSSADVILWATHSQGTPVSIMLLQRLLERGHIHLIRQSVCMLAMAGISHGPFPALKGSLIVKYFEADAARELFEFMDSTSPISIKFRQSLTYVLKCGVKVVLTGSMQDQVVPLYSAIVGSVQHPSILRSIYIDGHIYSQDDFLINLIVFALRLKNTGLSDHDLLTHLSEVLAGSLYALEGGHSTIYEELEVYMTAIRYTFETAPFGKHTRRTTAVTAETQDAIMDTFQAKQQLNPFYLPWALHGICCDPQILADESLKMDLDRLLVLFEQWNPTSARLKELKFRLEPFKTVKL